jgi:hypothetical protein
MVLAWHALVSHEGGLLTPLSTSQESSLIYDAIYWSVFWSILVSPTVFASASIWAASRRDQVIPPAGSLVAVFAAVARVYYLLATLKDSSNDWSAVIASLIGLHGVLLLILIPAIRWWSRRCKNR